MSNPVKVNKKTDSKKSERKTKNRSEKTAAEKKAEKELRAANEAEREQQFETVVDQISEKGYTEFNEFLVKSFTNNCITAFRKYILSSLDALRNQLEYDNFSKSYKNVADKCKAFKTLKDECASRHGGSSSKDKKKIKTKPKKRNLKKRKKGLSDSDNSDEEENEEENKEEKEYISNKKEKKSAVKKKTISFKNETKMWLGFLVSRFSFEIRKGPKPTKVKTSEAFLDYIADIKAPDLNNALLCRIIIPAVERFSPYLGKMSKHGLVDLIDKELQDGRFTKKRACLTAYISEYLVKYMQLIAKLLADNIWSKGQNTVGMEDIEAAMRHLNIGSDQWLIENKWCASDEADFGMSFGIMTLMREYVPLLCFDPVADRKKKEAAKKKKKTSENKKLNSNKKEKETSNDDSGDSEDSDSDDSDNNKKKPTKLVRKVVTDNNSDSDDSDSDDSDNNKKKQTKLIRKVVNDNNSDNDDSDNNKKKQTKLVRKVVTDNNSDSDDSDNNKKKPTKLIRKVVNDNNSDTEVEVESEVEAEVEAEDEVDVEVESEAEAESD